jgi:cephalosporin hydroxylase
MVDIIDPVPDFDVDAFVKKWATSATVHVGRSLDVMPGLPRPDIALIDGDHNWYTVYNELCLLLGPPNASFSTPPVVVLHDVGWPFGRRDAYYDLDGIPPDMRHPAEIGPVGMRSAEFEPGGTTFNIPTAVKAGGPRNGVRTAIEDALIGREDQFRLVWLEALHGLCVIVPKVNLEANSLLANLMDQLTPSPRLRSLMTLSELSRVEMFISTKHLGALSGRTVATPTQVKDRSLATSVPVAVWQSVQNGMMRQTYKNRAALLSPFDYYNYLHLIETLQPATIFEVGVFEGGRTRWLVDQLRALGIDGRVIALDLVSPAPFDEPEIEFIQGNALNLELSLSAARLSTLPHPFLVIEDAAHTFEVTQAVLAHFDPHLRTGDYVVVEDGNLGSVLGTPEISPPHDAIKDFLSRRGADYQIETSICDRYGYNVTANPNGWLVRR